MLHRAVSIRLAHLAERLRREIKIPDPARFTKSRRGVLTALIESSLRRATVMIFQVRKPELFLAFGIPPAKSRKQVRQSVRSIWPILPESGRDYELDAVPIGDCLDTIGVHVMPLDQATHRVTGKFQRPQVLESLTGLDKRCPTTGDDCDPSFSGIMRELSFTHSSSHFLAPGGEQSFSQISSPVTHVGRAHSSDLRSPSMVGISSVTVG